MRVLASVRVLTPFERSGLLDLDSVPVYLEGIRPAARRSFT